MAIDVRFAGDLRKLTGTNRVRLSPAERKERIRFKSECWSAANIEKRRESSRLSKRRLRAIYGRKKWVPKTFEALEKRRKRDREYSRRRYLLGLFNGRDARKVFSLDEQRQDGRDMHEMIDSGAMSPLQVLMVKEEAGYF